jgi:hypothetical protein
MCFLTKNVRIGNTVIEIIKYIGIVTYIEDVNGRSVSTILLAKDITYVFCERSLQRK